MRWFVLLTVLMSCRQGDGPAKKSDPAPIVEPTPTDSDVGPVTDSGTIARCGEAGVVPGTHPDLLRWPYLNSVSHDAAVVVWAVPPDATSGKVEWGTDGYDKRVSAQTEAIRGRDDEPWTLMYGQLTGLSPDTEYCYKVTTDGDELAGGLRFRTAPVAAGASIKFFVIGDFGRNSPEQLALRDIMKTRLDGHGFLLTTGDNAYGSGTWHEWQANVFDVYQELLTELPIWPTSGNHDYATADAAPYLANFVLPRQAFESDHQERYWSMEWGPMHMVGLDTEDPLDELTIWPNDDDQLDWLRATLNTSTKPWRIAAYHRPPYSGKPGRNGDLRVLTLMLPIFENHGVQVNLMGHNHFYERYETLKGSVPTTMDNGGIAYIITGGGGTNLYDLDWRPFQASAVQTWHFLEVEMDPCTFTSRAIDLTDTVIDEVTYSRCP